MDVNQGRNDKQPLLWAVLFKKSNAVRALIECGAQTNFVYEGNSLVACALKQRTVDLALLLLKNGSSHIGTVDGKNDVMARALSCTQRPSAYKTTKKRVLS